MNGNTKHARSIVSVSAPVGFSLGAISTLPQCTAISGNVVPTGSLPVLGQAVQGISAGLAGVSSMMGGAGAAARQVVKGLGVRGLDVGLGCGVGVGYGFGVGLMLRPSALDHAIAAGSGMLGGCMFLHIIMTNC